MTAYTGTSGNDHYTGTSTADTFDMSQGGVDKVSGGGGDDVVTMGSAFTESDSIDGGAGYDRVSISFIGGAQSTITFNGPTLTNVEEIDLTSDRNVFLTTNNATVAAGQSLRVDASSFSVSDALQFNGSAESNGAFYIIGGAGNDVLTGGAGNDTFDTTLGGNDTLVGNGGDDTFKLGALATSSSSVDGGAGYDTVTFAGSTIVFGATTVVNVERINIGANNSTSLTTNDATVAAGQTLLVDASALSSPYALQFDGSAETNGAFQITGGAGNDNLVGGAGNDTFDATLGGNDILIGGNGDDAFTFGAMFGAGNSIDGGAGNDTVMFNQVVPGTIVFTPTTMVNIEHIVLSSNAGASFVTDDATVAAGHLLYVDGSALTAGHTLQFDGSAETDGQFEIHGGAGNDVLTGGAGIDYFFLDKGGDDTVTTGGGNFSNFLYFGATYNGNDTLHLSSSGLNWIELKGDYSAGVTVTAASIDPNNNQILQLDAGYSYTLTFAADAIPTGDIIPIDARGLGSADVTTIDASATSGGIQLLAGQGTTIARGGAGTDYFSFDSGVIQLSSHAFLTPGDRIDGGAGVDQVTLLGDYSSGLAFTPTTMINVEYLYLNYGNFNLTTNDATVAAGQSLTLQFADTNNAHTLTFNGSAETDGAFVFRFDGSFTVADRLIGGAGNDLLLLNVATGPLAFDAATITSVETIAFANHSYVVTTNDANVATGRTLAVDAAQLTTGETLNFNGSAETDGHFAMIGGADNDVLTGGAQSDTFDASFGGNDTMSGGAGNDTFEFGGSFAANDTIDGGAGNDTVAFGGGTIVFGPTTMTNVERINLEANNSANLTTNNATVAAGETLTVDGSALGSGSNLTFNGSAETNGKFSITSGAGNDTLTGGAKADIFKFVAANLTSGDTVNGGTGSSVDQLTFMTADTIGAGAFANVSHIEQINLANGGNSLTLTDALVGSSDNASHILSVYGNASTDTIDASAVTTATNRVNFYSGAGADTLTGGAGADLFSFTVANLTSSDKVNGGIGPSSVDALSFLTAGTIGSGVFVNVSHIEQINLATGTNSLTLTDALVGSSDNANHILNVYGNVGNDTIDASAVTTVANRVFFHAGTGSDFMTAGAGADKFMYAGASDSTSTNYDTIIGFNFANDRFDTPGAAGTITAIDAAITTGTLDSGVNFDSELAAVESALGAHHAQLFTANAGTLSGQTFLIVDVNGTSGYQSGADLVIHLTTTTGTLTTGDFV